MYSSVTEAGSVRKWLPCRHEDTVALLEPTSKKLGGGCALSTPWQARTQAASQSSLLASATETLSPKTRWVVPKE